MKTAILFLLLVTGSISGTAQIKKKDSTITNRPVLKKIIVPGSAVNPASSRSTITPAATTTVSNYSQQKNSNTDASSQPPTMDNAQYFITGAMVTIKTGNDSKEYPSRVQVYLFPMPAATYTYTYTLAQLNLTNAMYVNASTEFGLTPINQQKIPWPVYYSPGYNGTTKSSSPFISGSHKWSLADLQQQGLRLLVAYHPNIALDAWEIKQVTVKLAIEKADGTPHPTLNNKTIVFNITTPMLGVPTGMALVCEADKNFMPTTNYLTKDILID